MTTTPIVSRGWCDLAECPRSTIPQDCVRFGSVTVCAPCLIDLSGGVEPEELARQEEASLLQDEQINALEEEIEKLKAQLEEAKARLLATK